ncbi:MAG: hypothetical protein RML56_08775 [Burkholderiales bacterium]|nr:hypothetical protein [Burkholderiales bacterium]
MFGTQAGPRVLQWPIEKDERTGALRIPAGALHQLGEGALFALMRAPADADTQALGYLAATRIELTRSLLAPAAHGQTPPIAASAVPEGAYARLVDPGLALALRVALPPPVAKPGPQEAKAKALLDQLAKETLSGLAIAWVPAREGADLRLLLRGGKLWLLSPSAELVAEGPHRSLSIDLAKNDPAQLREKLIESLRAIAKVVNLLRLAAHAASSPVAQKVDIAVEVERAGKTFALLPERVPALFAGDRLAVRIANRHTQPVDVTVLFMDSRYGIASLFPRAGESNRVVPNGRLVLDRFEVDADTVGRESLLFIVAEAEPGAASADFGFLGQARLEATRGGGAPGELRAILEAIGFAPERTRGLRVARTALDRVAIRLYTWETRARRAN